MRQVFSMNIDLVRGNSSHAPMKLSTQNMPLSKLVFTGFVLLAVTLQAAGQQPNPGPLPARDRAPGGQSGNADVQVWVGVDVLPGGVPVEGSYTSQAQNLNAQFAGVWSAETMPGFVLTLQLNGDFSLVTPVNLERRCAAGVERGNWVAFADTNELLFHIQTDTSGRCGLSDLESTMAVVKAEPGLTLVINDPVAGMQEIPLFRTEP
jgi:hypothetical protein